MPRRKQLMLPGDMPPLVLAYWLDAVGGLGALSPEDEFPPVARLSSGFLQGAKRRHITVCGTWDRMESPWDTPMTIPTGILQAMWELEVGKRIR